jgi:cytochrome oxidase assembly protein ShyY1
MRRLPVFATLVVAAAVALMISLGIWQLHRKQWKEGLLARYQAAAGLPPVAWPDDPHKAEALLFRRARATCRPPIAWSQAAGRNLRDEVGWSHIATCQDGVKAVMGWSRSTADPKGWPGGPIEGMIGPDRDNGIRLVAAVPAPGLEPSAAPSPANIPNNHFFYAIQWFLFAATAAVIFAIALRRRMKR